MTFEEAVKLLGGGLSAAVIAGLVWAVTILRAENRALAAKHIEDKDADKERLLRMADQNRELAMQTGAIVAANTAAMEAQRIRDERIVAILSRMEGPSR